MPLSFVADFPVSAFTKRSLALILALSTLFSCALFRDPETPVTAEAEPELVPEPIVLPPYESPPEPVPSDGAEVESGIQPEGGVTRGVLPKRALEQGVSAGMSAFQSCYAAALKQRPGLAGTIMVNFVVAPDGSVPYAAALDRGTDLSDASVIDCVLSEFQKLRFQEPTGGRAVVTYPLTFSANVEPAAGSVEP